MRRSPWWVLVWVGAVVAVLGVVGEFRSPASGDAATLLYQAGQILDGRQLYSQLVDINPPYTLAFHLPFVIVARVLGLNPMVLFRLGVLAIVACCAVLVHLVLKRQQADATLRCAIWASFLLATTGYVVGFFGEREHIQAVLIFPYLCHVAASRRASRVKGRMAAMTGIVAGFGIALKVTAAMVPVLVCLLVWWRTRRSPSASLWVIGTTLLLEIGGLLWAPGYLSLVKELAPFYRDFGGASALTLLTGGMYAWSFWVALAVMLVALPVMSDRWTGLVFSAAMFGFLLSVVVQGKNFSYHYYPVIACAVAVLVLALAIPPRKSGRWDALRRGLAAPALIGVSALFIVVLFMRLAGPAKVLGPLSADVGQLLSGVPSGTTIAMQTSRVADVQPLALLRGYQITGRFPCLWFIYPFDPNDARLPGTMRPYSDAVLTPMERRLRHAVAEDLAAERPALMVVRHQPPFFNMLQYLCDDPLFRQEAGAYRLVRSAGDLQLFARDNAESDGGACGVAGPRPT